jgi:ABC-2 type transport system ATP-binding protein
VGDWVVETYGLVKRYSNLVALNGLDLRVSRGAIGLLGPNGAGKSTLIKCLLRLHRINAGSARLLGVDIRKEGRSIRRRVGYTPEQDCHIPGMVGSEYVTYCAQLCGLPFDAARQRAHEMLDFVGMGQERYRRVDTYSTGMKQRLKLAQAIVHDPEVVFLDEPTNGLDPKGQSQMLSLIRSLWCDHGMTVILSTHLLHDVDQICDQIILLAQGRLLVHDTLEHLKAQRRGAAEVVVGDREEDFVEACRQRGWSSEILSNGHVRVEHGGLDVTSVLEVLRDLGLSSMEITPSPNALEEMYVQALEKAHGPA